REVAVAALGGFDDASERPLRFGARHPLSQLADVSGRRRDVVSRIGPAAEVDVLGEGPHHVFGAQAGRDLVLVAQVESRAAPQAPFGDPLLLDLFDAFALRGDAAVLALAPAAHLVELALELAAAIAVRLVLDALLEIFFVLALVDQR